MNRVEADEQKLCEILNGSNHAISEMEKVIEAHKGINTVIVNPDSWVGKELLIQTKRLIDLHRDVHSLALVINHLERKIDVLLNTNDAKK